MKLYKFTIILTIVMLLLSACQPKRSTPTLQPTQATSTSPATATRGQIIPSLPVQKATPTKTPIPDSGLLVKDSGAPLPPQIIDRQPGGGQELSLSGEVSLIFNQAMDQNTTASAWQMTDAEGEAVTGNISWPTPRTFRFKPNQTLQTGSLYLASLSTRATSAKGLALADPFNFQVTTVGELEVSLVFPADNSSEIDSKAAITIIFNRPVVPLVIAEQRDQLPDPLEVTPAISGNGEWINTSVFAFRPDQQLNTGTTYTARIKAGLADAGNETRLAQDYVWKFTTAAPGIDVLILKNGTYNPEPDYPNFLLDEGFSIRFLQPMNHTSTEAALSLVSDKGEAVPLATQWIENDQALVITPTQRLALDTHYIFQLESSAQAFDGGNLREGLNWPFWTIPRPGIEYTSPQDGSVQKYFTPEMMIKFRSPMRLDTVIKNIQVIPAPGKEFQWYYNEYDWSVSAFGLAPSTNYEIRLSPGMEDIYGNKITKGQVILFTTAAYGPQAGLQMPYEPAIFRSDGPQEFYVTYRNTPSVEVMLYRLTNEEFLSIISNRWSQYGYEPPSDRLVWQTRLQNAGKLNELTLKNLTPFDKNGAALQPGFYFLGLNAPGIAHQNSPYLDNRLMIVANLNLTFKSTGTETLIWTTNLTSGQPVSNVPLVIYDTAGKDIGRGVTDANGVLKLDVPLPVEPYDNRFVVSDVKANPGSTIPFGFASSEWGSGISLYDYGIWSHYYAPIKQAKAYIYTDRPIYRPGQPVYFKGIVRSDDDLQYSLMEAKDVFLRISSYKETVLQEKVALTDNSTFEGKLILDSEAALGYYSIEVYSSQDDLNNGKPSLGQLGFSVAEYRKPEYQVNVTATPIDVLAGQEYTISIQADYYSGGHVTDAQVDWTIRAEPFDFGNFVRNLPDDRAELAKFNFTDIEEDLYAYRQTENLFYEIVAEGKGQTGPDGRLEVKLTADLSKFKSSMRFIFEASVTDLTQSSVTGRVQLIAHRSGLYVGARPVTYIGSVGDEQSYEVIAVDWNAKTLAGQKVSVDIIERRWYSTQEQDASGRVQWTSSVQDIPVTSFKDLVVDSKGLATVHFTPPNGGIFRARVTAIDGQGNATSASAYLWVADELYIPWRQTNDRSFNLVVDRPSYKPGDTAEILIASPFQGETYALVTVERGHIRRHEVIRLTTNSTLYKLPITPDMAPNAFISVVVVKGVDSTNPRPNFKMGMAQISVLANQQTISVQIVPDRPQAGPGEQVTYAIRTSDYQNNPLSAEVSLSLTDLATLSLADPNAPAILDYFYSRRTLGVWTTIPMDLNIEDYNADIQAHIPSGGGMGAGGGKGGGDLGVIAVRQNFPDTPYWNAFVHTDDQGAASVTVTLPDNLTTWRMDARAVTRDTRVGQATQDIVSTKPLLVRPQTPRFFIANDQVTLGTAIHNNTDLSLMAEVTLDVQGVTLQSPDTQGVEIPAHQQAYVTWQVQVNADAQRVDLVFQVQGGGYADASRPPLGTLDNQGLPVYRYEARETVGTAGMMTGEGTRLEAINLPTNMNVSEGSLDIRIAPSLAAGMIDGLTYLEHYPYECIEQTISRFLPNVITTRALRSAGLSDPDLEQNLKEQVSVGLQRIYNWQLADGGWGWWPEQEKSDLLTSTYVVMGLLEAKEAGFEISPSVYEKGLGYLNSKLITVDRLIDPYILNRQAFVLYVLARAGQPNVSITVQSFNQRLLMNLYARGFLLKALHQIDPKDPRIQTVLSDINSSAIQSATGSHWEESKPDRWNWNTDTRTTAILLSTLSQIDPSNPLIANAVRWLMSSRSGDHWQGTQETAWSLMALTNWMEASGELKANYDYAVALNGQRLGGGTANAQTLRQTFELHVEVADMIKEEANRLVFARNSGPGNLYYTAHLSVNLPVEQVKALEQGIIISRGYYHLDDLKNPVTEAKVGDLLLVRITVIAPAALHYLVAEDPLPAGLEAVDQSLKTNQQNIEVPPAFTWEDIFMRGWGWWYFDHSQLMDEKVVLSASFLPAGTYVYNYLARASTSGTFRVIPPTAQEFYFPEIYGRGDGSIFTIK